MQRVLSLMCVAIVLVGCAGAVTQNSAPSANTPSVSANEQLAAPTAQPKKSFQPTTTPVASNVQPQTSNVHCAAYMTFAINTHDIRYVSNSADTILRLIGIFEKYNARGDFYLTAPIVEMYSKQRPDVIERLKKSQMTISYHVRPPHPAYPGFDARLKTLDDKTLEQTLRDYEMYRLDLTTGNLDKTQPGGYAYVAQMLGRKPVVASPQAGDARIRKAMLKIYAEMGARMLVAYHEEGTDIANPFVFEQGLLQRPSDFSVTRWGEPGPNAKNDKGVFWWNMLTTPKAAEYNPTNYLQMQLAAWKATRVPFVTSLIHEDNYYRSGSPWHSFFYDDNDKPKSPPYNLNTPDDSRARNQEQMGAIWKAYEELVVYATKNTCVVTSEDIVKMAGR